MAERYWNKIDISKEEMRNVHLIVRCYRYFLGAYKEKKIKRKEFEFYKHKCIYALNLCEWYYSDSVTRLRDFKNWSDSFKEYQEVRKLWT